MTIIKEVLKVYKGKDIKSVSFLTKVSKSSENSLDRLFTTTGYFTYEDDGRRLTQKGLSLLKNIIHGYIANALNMGYNIANQSIDSVSDDDWLEILNVLEKLNKWKQSIGIIY